MKKYLTSVSAFQLYHLIRYSAFIVTGIVFTKTTLTSSEIGQWETFLFIAGAVTFFWLNSVLKALLMTGPGDADAKSDNQAVFTAFVIISVLSILTAGFLLMVSPLVSKVLLNGNGIPFMGLLIIYLVFGIPANMVEFLYLLRKENAKIISYGIVSFVFQLICVLLPAVMGAGIRMALAGLLISMVARWCWLLFILLKYHRGRFSMSVVRKLMVLAWPLMVSALLSGSAQYVDGFIITSRFSREVFAIFQYGARELPLAVLLANALGNSLLPEFKNRSNLNATLLTLKENSRKLMHYLFPLTMILLLLSHPLFPVLFNPAFAASATIFNIYLLLVISRLVFPQLILTGLAYTREIMVASFLELVINVAFSLMLVLWWGIAGVAAGTVIAFLFEKIFLAALVRRKLGIRASGYIPLKLLGAYSLLTGMVFIFAELILSKHGLLVG